MKGNTNRAIIIGVIIICTVTIFRIYIGTNLPIWMVAAANQDDFWMVYEADLPRHFAMHYNLSLAKPMSYPIFLQAVNLMSVAYRLAVCFLWAAAAGLTTLFIRRLTKNMAVLTAVYTFVLYCPVGFDGEISGRLYRSVIIPPTVFIVIALLLLVSHHIIFRRKGFLKAIVISLALGAAFLFFYYIKEEGVWLFPIFAGLLGAGAISIFKGKGRPVLLKDKMKYLVIAMLPLIVFAGGTNIYKAINFRYFGVYEINTRTESAFADFSSRLFRIENEKKTTALWLPISVFEQAWDASPALRQYPQVLDDLKHSPWASGDFEAIHLPGDFPLWAFRDALAKNGLYATEKQVQDLLTIACAEIDEAFENGSLQKEEGKIYLSKASNGRTVMEIFSLAPMVVDGWKNGAFYSEYHTLTGPKSNNLSNPELAGRLGYAETFIHDSFATPESMQTPGTQFSLKAGTAIINIYQAMAFGLLPLSLLGFVLLIMHTLGKRRDGSRFLLLSMAMLAFSAFAYILGVAWFSDWLGKGAMAVYAVGAIPVIQLLEILGIYYLFLFLLRRNLARRQDAEGGRNTLPEGP